MTKFISNVNKYLLEMKIKQNYLSMITGIDKKSGSDMEKIAAALGKSVEYFLDDNINIPNVRNFEQNKIAFYAGEPSEKQEKIAMQLMELMENIDEVVSAESRFKNIAR